MTKCPKCKACKNDATSGYNVGSDRYCDECFERYMRQSSDIYQKMAINSMSSSAWQDIYKSRRRWSKKCKRK